MLVVDAVGGGGVVARIVQRYPLAYHTELRVKFSLRPETRLPKDDRLCPCLVTSINC